MNARYRASPRGGNVHMTECTRESLASTLIENERGGSNLLINFIQKTETSEKKTTLLLLVLSGTLSSVSDGDTSICSIFVIRLFRFLLTRELKEHLAKRVPSLNTDIDKGTSDGAINKYTSHWYTQFRVLFHFCNTFIFIFINKKVEGAFCKTYAVF